MSSRTKVLATIVLIAVAAAGIGMYAGSRLKSPEQIAAETAPPEPSLITVPIESRTLSRDVITRANAEYLDSNDLTLTPNVTSGSSQLVPGRVPGRHRARSRRSAGVCL